MAEVTQATRLTLPGMAGALLACALTACAHAPSHYYYSLTYPPPEPRFDAPFPFSIRVREFDVRDTYGGAELVFRRDLHEIQYFKSRRWSARPKKMISALVRDHLQRSGVVRQVIDSLGAAMPDFTFTGEVEEIEQLAVGSDRYAHLAITFRLSRFEDDSVLWRFRFDERRPVGGDSVRGTVRTLADLLREGTGQAIDGLGRYLADPTAPAPTARKELVEAGPPHPEEDAIVRPDAASPYNDDPQLQLDETPVPVGFGSAFVPALSSGDREPLVMVYRDGSLEAEGRAGSRIVVTPGEYEVRVGSGALDQRVASRVRIEEGRTTVVPPTWSGLAVEVVDQQFVPFRGTYELIRMDTREDFGVGFGADEQLGEQTKVWLLPPGLYKLIRSGGTYRDRESFATVRLLPNHLTQYTLVQDPQTGAFVGAGEVDPQLGEEELAATEDAWRLRGVVGGDVAFTRSDQVGQQQGWSLGAAVFFDGGAQLDVPPHLWVTRLDLEEERERLPEREGFDLQSFRSKRDRLYFHTLYTYRLLPWFGPYARAGFETKLLPRYYWYTEEGRKPDQLGAVFSPIQLKQGAGGNFRALRTAMVELDLRLGIGGRQTFANGLRVPRPDASGLEPLQDARTEGIEGTVVMLGRFTRRITLSSELDGLFPFGDLQETIYTWRNQASLRLLSFASLVYRLEVSRDPTLFDTELTTTEHDVQLRFSYTLF